MTSGVYELKFTNGARYIGKSIDIHNRWKQHLDKMRKGTAATAMQQAYRMYGAPATDIMLECHSDHIDIMEAVFIARHNPELNSDRPGDPFIGVDIDWYVNNTDFLKLSTLQHMKALVLFHNKQKEAKEVICTFAEKLDELTAINKELLAVRSEETISKDISGKIKELRSQNLSKQQIVDTLISANAILTEQLEYNARPWWQKIFK